MTYRFDAYGRVHDLSRLSSQTSAIPVHGIRSVRSWHNRPFGFHRFRGIWIWEEGKEGGGRLFWHFSGVGVIGRFLGWLERGFAKF